MYKVIIAGSRTFTDYDLLEDAMNQLLKGWKKKDIEIVSGGAKGADRLGERYAKKHHIKLKMFPADWSIGNAAGIIRNMQMGDYADCLVAFTNGSRGTAHMIKYAKQQELEVVVIDFDGNQIK